MRRAHASAGRRSASASSSSRPTRVAEITGLPEERIVALGQRIATTRPTGIRCTQGMQRHAGGGDALRLLYALPGRDRRLAVPGRRRVVLDQRALPAPNVDGVFRDDLLRAPVRTLNMTRLGEAPARPRRPAGEGARRLRREPDGLQPGPGARARRGCMREDLFTVVMEQFPTDTVDYADIVLPATMQTEHLDVNDGYGHIVRAPQPAGGRAAPASACRRWRRSGGSRARWGSTSPRSTTTTRTLARTLLGDARLRAAVGATAGRGSTTRRRTCPFTDGFPTPSGKLEFFSERARGRRARPAPRLRRRRR